jgi:uncharacterized membrane protein
VDHPVWYPPYAVSASARPGAQTVNAGGEATFTLTIYNDGTEADNYKIEVTSTKGWPVVLDREKLTLASGQVENVKIISNTPQAENLERENKKLERNDYTVKVIGTGVSAETSFSLIVETGVELPQRPWPIIAVVIVVIVVIAAAYFILKRK